MKHLRAGLAALVLMAAGLPQGALAEGTDQEGGAEEDAKPEFDRLAWIQQEPEPDAAAQAAFEAWLAERDAILSGQKEGTKDWHAWVREYQVKAEAAETPFAREIYERVALDQYGRYSGLFSLEHSAAMAAALGHPLEGASVGGFHDRVMKLLMRTDVANTAFLKAELEARGGRWWAISEVGADVSGNIWLITQHADLDRDFQRRALVLMEPLALSGEVDRQDFGYLMDRVAVAEKRPQRFGTQGRCVSPGDWEAFEIEAPAEEVNTRRAAFDFKNTFEQNDDRLDALCAE